MSSTMRIALVVVLVLSVIVLASCSSTPAEIAADHELVKQFFLDNPDAKIESSSLVAAAEGSLAYASLANACGEGVLPGQYTKIIYASEKDSNRMVAYINMDRKEAVCVRAGAGTSALIDKAFSQEVFAYIDDTPVTLNALQTYIDTLAQNGQNVTPETALSALISNTLIQREVDAKGITATQQEVDALLQTTLQQANITQQQLMLALDRSGQNLTTYESLLAAQVRVNKLLSQEVYAKVPSDVTEDDMKNAYISSVNKLFVPAQARVRHIFFTANVSDPADAARISGRAQAVGLMLNATNFCELAAAYSEDAGSRANCGEVIFSQGQVLPEFESAVFSAQLNLPVLIQTRRGYHIVEVLETAPLQVAPYALPSVKKTLQDQILSSRTQQVYLAYLGKLWAGHVTLRQDLAGLGNFTRT